MNILAIDTSNQVLGVAIMQQNELVAEIITNIKRDHSSRLMPAIVDLMEEVGMVPDQLNKIVIAHGPGSYTGTRIGVTTAKTLAWSLEIPIYTVSSLDAVAINGKYFNGYICPFFDARRQTVFTSLLKWKTDHLHTKLDERNISMEDWLMKLLELDSDILFLSPHIASFKEMITSILGDHAVIPEDNIHLPRPQNLISLSSQIKDTPVHLVSPNYLRITEAEANWLKRQKDGQSYG